MTGLLSEDRRRVMINPGSRRLLSGDTAVLITTKQTGALRAMRRRFHPPSAPRMAEVISDRVRYQVFQNPDSDYFSTPEAPLQDDDGEVCIDPPYIGQLETESVDDGDGVCLHMWDVVDRGWGGEDFGTHAQVHNEEAVPEQVADHVTNLDTTVPGPSGAVPVPHTDASGVHCVAVSAASSAAPSVAPSMAQRQMAYGAPSTSNNGLDSDAYSMLGPASRGDQGNGTHPCAKPCAECTHSRCNPHTGSTTAAHKYDELGTLQPTAAEYSPIAWDVEELRGHVIVCGSEHSFVPFMEQLRASSPNALPVVFLHPARPTAYWRQLSAMGPIFWVQGTPSETASLRAANAQQARALVFLTHPYRPKNLDRPPDDAASSEAYASTRSRAAVLADSDALLTCYGVGEDSGMERLHSVVELTFTSSVRFLQPGLLLKGVRGGGEGLGDGPRRGWRMRKAREAAAVAEGLAEWQVGELRHTVFVIISAGWLLLVLRVFDVIHCQKRMNHMKDVQYRQTRTGVLAG